ncbi:GntR family transcriptional regulator [Peptostreptococcus equinus]|uniref:GntR family transcriptional regulator n=1 Tax=Peptostreptococcus equinus TaxID=3003601 RepID=A0ABY7JS61_9FIRM|nr:GntR family transcriptional regulator [Peptostreptococcus sp. CBA3647]WAW15331.1 GntR family transcriptional regulator [Peptostreptococcus sp. CBA3647]
MDKPISSDVIYYDLLDKIINLRLEPGSKLSENQACLEYNVSRSVVRNAFARLTQNGFLTVYPQRGTYVSKIDLEYIRTALLIRISIEKEVLNRFMKKDNKEDVISKMEENINQQLKFYNENDYIEEFRRLDEQFHEYIMLSVETNNILALLNEHLLHISRWRNVYVKSGYRLAKLIDEHKLILDAIKENNCERALEGISNHIDTVSTVINSKGEFSHYFID